MYLYKDIYALQRISLSLFSLRLFRILNPGQISHNLRPANYNNTDICPL